MVPEKVSLKAGIVVGGVSWSILIDAGKVGITIVFPVEQLGGRMVSKKLADSNSTVGKFKSQQRIKTGNVLATSDAYRV